MYPVVKGKLTAVEVINGGSGYTSTPIAILITDSGAAATIAVSIDATTKKVTGATIKNQGAGYPITTF